MRTFGITSNKDVFYKVDMDITSSLSLQQEQPEKDKNVNRPARFLVVGNLPIPRYSSLKRMQLTSRSLTKAIRNGGTSPIKSFILYKNVTKTPTSTSSTQTKQIPLGLWDSNAVSIRLIRPPDSSLLA